MPLLVWWMSERQPPYPVGLRQLPSGYGLGGHERDARRLGTLRALSGLELHLRVLGERLVALADDCAVVDEQVLAAVVGDNEPIPLVGVEPLHGSGCHR